jgi:hypothetical protein
MWDSGLLVGMAVDVVVAAAEPGFASEGGYVGSRGAVDQ